MAGESGVKDDVKVAVLLNKLERVFVDRYGELERKNGLGGTFGLGP